MNRAGKLDTLSHQQRRDLKHWVLDKAMPEGGRNLTAAGILEHIVYEFGIQVLFYFISYFYYYFIIVIIIIINGKRRAMRII